MTKPATFHHKAMAALDAIQASGETFAPWHAMARRALRKAQMRGGAIASAEELARATMAEQGQGAGHPIPHW